MKNKHSVVRTHIERIPIGPLTSVLLVDHDKLWHTIDTVGHQLMTEIIDEKLESVRDLENLNFTNLIDSEERDWIVESFPIINGDVPKIALSFMRVNYALFGKIKNLERMQEIAGIDGNHSRSFAKAYGLYGEATTEKALLTYINQLRQRGNYMSIDLYDSDWINDLLMQRLARAYLKKKTHGLNEVKSEKSREDYQPAAMLPAAGMLAKVSQALSDTPDNFYAGWQTSDLQSGQPYASKGDLESIVYTPDSGNPNILHTTEVHDMNGTKIVYNYDVESVYGGLKMITKDPFGEIMHDGVYPAPQLKTIPIHYTDADNEAWKYVNSGEPVIDVGGELISQIYTRVPEQKYGILAETYHSKKYIKGVAMTYISRFAHSAKLSEKGYMVLPADMGHVEINKE